MGLDESDLSHDKLQLVMAIFTAHLQSKMMYYRLYNFFSFQTCNMLFGSWTHTSDEIDVDFIFPGGLDLSTFQRDFKVKLICGCNPCSVKLCFVT